MLKNWCFWTVVLEKTLESPLDCKEIQPVNPKENQSWIFIRRTDVEAEAPVFWSPDTENWLIEKTLMLGKIEDRKRRGWQRMRWLDGITDSMGMNLSKLWAFVKDREAWHAVVHWAAKSWTQLTDWTELNVPKMKLPVLGVLSVFFLFFFVKIYLAAPGLSCSLQGLWSLLWHLGSSSLTRDQTQVPCTGSAES